MHIGIAHQLAVKTPRLIFTPEQASFGAVAHVDLGGLGFADRQQFVPGVRTRDPAITQNTTAVRKTWTRQRAFLFADSAISPRVGFIGTVSTTDVPVAEPRALDTSALIFAHCEVWGTTVVTRRWELVTGVVANVTSIAAIFINAHARVNAIDWTTEEILRAAVVTNGGQVVRSIFTSFFPITNS